MTLREKLSNLDKRKNFLRAFVYLSLLIIFAYSFFIGQKWLRIERIDLSSSPTLKIVHFTDLHYKGDKIFLNKVVNKINELNPDIVCFTGDFVEDNKFLPDALDSLSKINKPLYGVPGNHEYWHNVDLESVAEVFRKTGGDFISSENGGAINVGGKNIYLLHHPDSADELSEKYDLILAGHSHGGQIRIPFFGALILPYKAKHYDKGFYRTSNGPLYVNPGIGTYFIPVRFFCRPEITLISI